MSPPDAAEVLAAAAAWVYVPEDAREVRTDDFHLVAYPPHWSDPTALRIASDRPAVDVVDEALAAAADLGRHELLVWTHDGTRPAELVDHLLARGATVHEELGILARSLADLPDLPDLAVPDDVEVRPTTDLETQRDHERIGVEVFGGTVRDDDALLAAAARSGPDDGVGLVAYRDGEPVATGGYSVADGVLRLWGGATLPQGRGAGAYRAVLAHRLALGVEQGCRLALVKGRLTTSAPILRRAGFEQYGEERAYLLQSS